MLPFRKSSKGIANTRRGTEIPMTEASRITGHLPGTKKALAKESQAPLNSNQFVEYLRDHLLLDKRVD
jgi:hypothetical protein